MLWRGRGTLRQIIQSAKAQCQQHVIRNVNLKHISSVTFLSMYVPFWRLKPSAFELECLLCIVVCWCICNTSRDVIDRPTVLLRSLISDIYFLNYFMFLCSKHIKPQQIIIYKNHWKWHQHNLMAIWILSSQMFTLTHDPSPLLVSCLVLIQSLLEDHSWKSSRVQPSWMDPTMVFVNFMSKP